MIRLPRKKLHALAIAILLVLLWPCSAHAHLVTTGLGPVYDGVGHLVTTVEDLIPVIGLALLAGLRGPESGRKALFVLPLAWFVGGLVGLSAPSEVTFPFQCASFLALGVLIAFNVRLSAMLVATIALTLGVVHGYADGSAIKDAGVGPGVLELLGLMVSLFVIVAIMSALVIWLRWDWTRIVIRVAGSWIAAIGLLLLGWAIHKGA